MSRPDPQTTSVEGTVLPPGLSRAFFPMAAFPGWGAVHQKDRVMAYYGWVDEVEVQKHPFMRVALPGEGETILLTAFIAMSDVKQMETLTEEAARAGAKRRSDFMGKWPKPATETV